MPPLYQKHPHIAGGHVAANTPKTHHVLALTPAVAEMLASDARLELRGANDTHAALVSSSRTVVLKGVAHSNTLMLTEVSSDAVTSHTVLNESLEPAQLPLDVHRIQCAVAASTSRGTNTPDDAPYLSHMSLDDLRSQTPADDASLCAALARLHMPPAASGSIVVLPPAFRASIFARACNVPDIAADTPALVSFLASLVASRDSVCDARTAHDALSFYVEASPVGGPSFLVRELGLALLQESASGSHPAKFLADWRAAAGQELAPLCDTALLRGYCVHTPDAVRYLSRDTLSTDPSARFAALFRILPAWDDAALLPFVDALAPDPAQLGLLLVKYARKIASPQGVTWTPRTAFF